MNGRAMTEVIIAAFLVPVVFLGWAVASDIIDNLIS